MWVRHRRAELALAAAFLTRLPIPAGWTAGAGFAVSLWAHPLIGALIGAGGGAVLIASAALGVPPLAAAAIALLATALLTGALHEDGLADCGDALIPAGLTRERRLAILKDSRIGAHGALLLLLVKLAGLAALAALPLAAGALALMLAHGAARLLPALVLRIMPPARTDGLGAGAGRPPARAMIVATATALLLPAFLAAIWINLGHALQPIDFVKFITAALVFSVLPAMLLCATAWRMLGGQTGDVCGAAEQLGETGLLLAVAAMLAG